MGRRVFIVDDDESVRIGLKRLLFMAGFDVHLFSTANDFLEAGVADLSGCVVLDIRMPGLNGLDLQRELSACQPSPSVIFITGHGDIPLAVSAIQKGAFDFLTKPFEEGQLLDKIADAVAEYRTVQQELDQVGEVQNRFDSLTPREIDVMQNIVSGLSNKKIANALNISPRTVEIHRARVMDKMAADSVASLVHMATLLGQAGAPAVTDEN